MKRETKALVEQVGKQFTNKNIKQLSVLGNGLINDTFLVSTNDGAFVLQRINAQVFHNPKQIMENLAVLNQHVKNSVTQAKLNIPSFIETVDQQAGYIDETHHYWRALEYIENTLCKEQISNLLEAEQVGFALGHFHRLLSDVDIELFHDTLPGFHITPSYFKHYQLVVNSKKIDSEKVQRCEQFIDDFRAKIDGLERAKDKGLLVERITHGDPKLNNFLFDKQTATIVSLIDLDTVKPGLVHYDIADCLRSCCHKTPSNTFDLALCDTILNSYLQEAASFFTQNDYDFLYLAIELIPFELGLRFFTDYLEGNKYFKVDSKEQNLDRAVAQFELCKDIGGKEKAIKTLISGHRKREIASL